MNIVNVNCAQTWRQRWIRGNALGKTLDVGANDGFMLRTFKDDVIFYDQKYPHEQANWRKKSPLEKDEIERLVMPRFIKGSAEALPKKDRSFDTIILGDILEHVPDPVAVLREAGRVSRFQVIATVPDEDNWKAEAVPYWVHPDAPNPHVRFYKPDPLPKHLEDSGMVGAELFALRGGLWAFFCVRWVKPC